MSYSRCQRGPGLNFLTRVGLGQVSHPWFEYGFGKFPLKMSNFSIFCPSGQKISLDQVKKYPGQRQFGLFFTAGQKYVGVWSGQGPSLRCHIKEKLFSPSLPSHWITHKGLIILRWSRIKGGAGDESRFRANSSRSSNRESSSSSWTGSIRDRDRLKYGPTKQHV